MVVVRVSHVQFFSRTFPGQSSFPGIEHVLLKRKRFFKSPEPRSAAMCVYALSVG